jgi:competence protein ComEC
MALAWAAAAWIAGAVAYALFGADAWPLVLALAAILAVIALVRRDRTIAIAAGTLPLILAASILRADLHDQPLPSHDVAHLAGGPDMRLRGIVRADPDIGDTSQRFTISVREVHRAGEWQPASGGVQIRSGLYPRYEAGDILELEGAIELPPTDVGFNFAEYLAQRGIHSVMDFPKVAVVGHDDANILTEAIRDLRRDLSRGLSLALPEPQASLAKGVLLGQRSALPTDLSEDLNATNTSHLVVVSGANVVLVSAFTMLLLAWAVGVRWARWLSIAAILAYMLLVGLSPPVVRGTIMGILLVLAQLSGRRTNGFVSILVAAALMIAVDPDAVRDVSFQLTFAATAGIVFLAGPIHDWTIDGIARVTRRESIPRAVSSLIVLPLATTIAAIIATEPLVALNFERLSLVAIPANMLIVPVFPYILASSLIAAIGGLLPFAHIVLGAPAYFLLSYWIGVAGWLASLPAASISFDSYTSWWAVATYAVLGVGAYGVVAWVRRPETGRLGAPISFRRAWPFAIGAIPAAVLIATAGFILTPDTPARLRVTVLDIGQGDAILIQTPGGADVLIDGGPGPAVLRSLGDELAWHDRSIDLVVSTHTDADHIYGLIDVLETYEVARVITGHDQSVAPDEWFVALDAKGIVAEPITAGTSFDLGDGITLDVLWSAEAPLAANVNNSSLVLKLRCRDVGFLLTGDIEAPAEEALLASGVELSATVLKVAHHGSTTSSTRDFLDAVGADVSVISAGANNTHGHPAPEVVDRLDDYGPVFVTATAGAVTFETDGSTLWIETGE